MGSSVVVVGGSGRLGTLICRALNSPALNNPALRQQGQITAVGTSRTPSADQILLTDITDPRSITEALAQADAVVVAVAQTEPQIQRVCAQRGIPCVDVTVSTELLDAAAESLSETSPPSVLMCGLFPGLSGILARHTAAQLDQVSTVRVGLLQSTNADVGPTGTKDMLRMIGRPVPTDQNEVLGSSEVPGFSEPRPMGFGHTTRTLRLIRHDEAAPLQRHLPEARIEYCTAWQSSSFTRLIAGLRRTGLLRRLAESSLPIQPRHDPATPETVLLSAEVHGISGGSPTILRRTVRAASDYGATAEIAAAVVRRALRSKLPGGVQTPMDHVEPADLSQVRDISPQL